MKAKEYFEKYADGIYKEAHQPGFYKDGPIMNLMRDLLQEANQIIVKRKVKCDEAFLSVLREQNQKCNAITNLFEKKYGVSPIRRDAFKIILAHTYDIPEEDV